jgi:hypothetical protein
MADQFIDIALWAAQSILAGHACIADIARYKHLEDIKEHTLRVMWALATLNSNLKN